MKKQGRRTSIQQDVPQEQAKRAPMYGLTVALEDRGRSVEQYLEVKKRATEGPKPWGRRASSSSIVGMTVGEEEEEGAVSLSDRRSLFLHASLAIWRNRQLSRGFRAWKEEAAPALLALDENFDLDAEALRILCLKGVVRSSAAAESKLLGDRKISILPKAMPMSRRDSLGAFDLDILVIWARQRHPKAFSGVDDATVREAMRYMSLRECVDGEVLFYEGDIGDMFYMLLKGDVAVYVGLHPSHSRGGKNRGAVTTRPNVLKGPDELATLGKRVFMYREGDYFGETAMFTMDSARTASAAASGPCQLCQLPKDAYRRTLRTYHQLLFDRTQKVHFLQRMSLFRDWPRPRLEALADTLTKRVYDYNDHLFTANISAMSSCYLVLSGTVKVTAQIQVSGSRKGAGNGVTLRNQKFPGLRGQMVAELQAVLPQNVVALEVLLSEKGKAPYTAVAATACVEVYELQHKDAKVLMKNAQPGFAAHVEELCRREANQRNQRAQAAYNALYEREVLRRGVNRVEEEQTSPRKNGHENAETSPTTSSRLPGAAASTFIHDFDTKKLHSYASAIHSPMTSRVSTTESTEQIQSLASPKMLSTCVKNFMFENSDALEDDYLDRISMNFPVITPSITSSTPKVSLMSGWSPRMPMSDPSSPLEQKMKSMPTRPHQDDRWLRKQLRETKIIWNAGKSDFELASPRKHPSRLQTPSRDSTSKTHRKDAAFRNQLKEAQQTARRLIQAHLQHAPKDGRRNGETAPFTHYF